MGKKSQTHDSSAAFRQHFGVLASFVLISFIACIFSYQYYNSLHTTIRAESQNYLMEVSHRVGSNLDRITEDNFSILETMAASLEYQAPQTIEEARPLLQAQQGSWDFSSILLVNSNGTAYSIGEDGAVFFAFDDSMREELLAGRRAMTNTQLVNNREYIIFAVPVKNQSIGGEEIIALAACYDPAALDQVLSLTSFNDQAYSQIVTRSGTLVTRSGSPSAIRSGYNIFSTLEKATLDPGSDLGALRQAITLGSEGQISFSYEGNHWYMMHTRLAPQDWYLLTFVPFQVVNEKSDLLLQTTLYICGLIAALFGILTAALVSVFQNNRKRLEQIAYVDDITGGNTIQRFYGISRPLIEQAPVGSYALVYTNIQSFKVLNSQLGRSTCDAILYHFHTYADSVLLEGECMGRLSADNFCILMHYTDEEALIERLANWAIGAEDYIAEAKVSWVMPGTEFGIYVISENTLTFPEMIDRAKMALKEFPRPVLRKLRCAFYDDTARRQIFREKQLSDMMEESLAKGEFQVYLQPKYRLPQEQVGGAEALVRWKSASEGMIFPDDFIPTFEKTGQIIPLDLWVFEEVCRTIRRWMDMGLAPLKISVNCSRVHLKNPYFLTPYTQLADQYGIDRQYLEIELTESVVFGNTEDLNRIIEKIHAAGFGCSMDDFGSGYSSLNLIQNIPVDTLKIDKIFFRQISGEETRTEAVVHSIVDMAKALSMTTVAEGVEYREQVEMLKRIGCDYIQGYVFAKPMEISAFEALAYPNEMDKTGDMVCPH